jgi:hypothetical protein
MPDLDALHRFLRLSHVAVGFVGVALFWVPILAAKGGRLHVLSGRLFVGCAYYVGATGLAGSLWGLVHPQSFFEGGALLSVDAERARQVVREVRFVLAITGFLALAIMAGVALGVRVMRHCDLPAVRTPGMLALLAATGLWSAFLAVHGAGGLVAGCAAQAGADAAPHQHWIHVALGAMGVYGTVGDLRFLYAREPTRLARRAVHIQCMISSGAGFYAAFLLFGAARVFGISGAWQLVAPLVPLVGASFAAKWLTARDARRIARAVGPRP